jgi:hypothetical protein
MLLWVKRQHKWFEHFRVGAELTEDEQCSGSLLTMTTDKNILAINEVIRENKKLNDSRNI